MVEHEGIGQLSISCRCFFVIFGKLYHNRFQEQVFPKGTFIDAKLRQHMKEDTFEMTILEALNVDKVTEFMNNQISTEGPNHAGKRKGRK
jgi:hypothetical protein